MDVTLKQSGIVTVLPADTDTGLSQHGKTCKWCWVVKSKRENVPLPDTFTVTNREAAEILTLVSDSESTLWIKYRLMPLDDSLVLVNTKH